MDGTDSILEDRPAGEWTQSQAQAAQLVFEAQMDAVRALREIVLSDAKTEHRIQAAIALLTINP
jgi:hypothetical protein